MKNMYFVKDSEIRMEYLETGEGNHVNLQDVFGKPEGAPFTFGMYEMKPSKGYAKMAYATYSYWR